MKFHREGYKLIFLAAIILLAINLPVYFLVEGFLLTKYILLALSLLVFILVLQFFRVPKRIVVQHDSQVISPADGKVVAIEEVTETEYFNDRRIQVSIFMSPVNVHINWYPVDGVVRYSKYHPGKFLVAWHPKSSTENERTTVVVETPKKQEVLFRQIAGAVARRIVCYSKVDEQVEQATEYGFIKFGSRVDLLLPLNSEILVELNQKVRGSQTVIAALPD